MTDIALRLERLHETGMGKPLQQAAGMTARLQAEDLLARLARQLVATLRLVPLPGP